MIQGELSVKINFDESDRPKIREALNVISDIKFALEKIGYGNENDIELLNGTMDILTDVLEGNTF